MFSSLLQKMQDKTARIALKGANIQYNDPYIPSFVLKGREYYSVKLKEATLGRQDLVLITTNHQKSEAGKKKDSPSLMKIEG